MSLTAVVTNVSCYGAGNGNINTTVTGGTTSYSYAWSNGSTVADPNSLVPGTYSVTVTDAHGCTTSGSWSITQPTSPISGGGSCTPVHCHGGSDGGCSSSWSGGWGGYSYSWSCGETTSGCSSKCAGTYTCTATDSHGCACSHTYTVTQPSTALSVCATVTNPSSGCSYDGDITTSCSGGTGSYHWSWSNGCSSYHNPSLCEATYCLTASDDNGCTCSGSWTLTHEGCGGGWRTTNTETDSNQNDLKNKIIQVASVKVYPNPTVGTFTVEVPSNFTTSHISVTDLKGNEVASRDLFLLTGNTADFNLSNEAAGTYIVNVTSGTNKYSVKVVLN